MIDVGILLIGMAFAQLIRVHVPIVIVEAILRQSVAPPNARKNVKILNRNHAPPIATDGAKNLFILYIIAIIISHHLDLLIALFMLLLTNVLQTLLIITLT